MTAVRLCRSRYQPADSTGARLRGGLCNSPEDLWEVQERINLGISKVTPVQAVPPVIVPRESNYLLNPEHPQFDQLKWGCPEPFRFDPRLIGPAAE